MNSDPNNSTRFLAKTCPLFTFGLYFSTPKAISYLIHIKGHDTLGNAYLLKEMRAFHNVSNQGSWLKFNVVALNIEYREEAI